MIEVVKNYLSYTESLKELIYKSNYKIKYFIELLKISEPTFYKKLRENTFNKNQVDKITEKLYPEEYYRYKFNKELELSIKDENNGDLVDAGNHIKELRKKYLVPAPKLPNFTK